MNTESPEHETNSPSPAEYAAEVENLLQSTYGIAREDCADRERIESARAEGVTPGELVQWIGEKYNLRPIA